MNIRDKYARHNNFYLYEREWPNKQIEKAPRWCSVDLRDGNQALPKPMSVQKKLEFFALLCKLGFKEIEVGFPAASSIEFDFVRKLIDENGIPNGVVPQVLTQCRKSMIATTLQSLSGAKEAIIHIYCSTSPMQRRVVFNMGQDEILNTILNAVNDVMTMQKDWEGNVILEVSPEHFNETELDFTKRIFETVAEKWLAHEKKELIFNLPATVEYSSPNIFADQVEWIHRNLSCRKEALLSVHAHNDRGCAVAASELALLAGADRIEGTLFGNGERTGNADLICLAGNMIAQGIDPMIELSGLPEICSTYENLTGMKIGERVPYAGSLVFTAFSGSHQDAISKGKQARTDNSRWQVPYLPVDPADFGRTYEPVVRINSQSGKGGLNYVLLSNYGIELPKPMLKDFAGNVQQLSEKQGELLPEEIFSAFQKKYVLNQKYITFSGVSQRKEELEIKTLIDGVSSRLTVNRDSSDEIICAALGALRGIEISAASTCVQDFGGPCSRMICYASIEGKGGSAAYGAAIGINRREITINALVSAINDLIDQR